MLGGFSLLREAERDKGNNFKTLDELMDPMTIPGSPSPSNYLGFGSTHILLLRACSGESKLLCCIVIRPDQETYAIRRST